jgi:hypothetical protein
MKRILLAGAAASVLATFTPFRAQAATTTFDFSVVFDIQSLANFTSAFPGAATSQFTTGGLYEETNTATKTVVNVGGTGTAPTLGKVFAQNTSPSNELDFTSFGTNPSAIFPGFALSNLPGVVPPAATWQYVQTLSTTTRSFTEKIGAAATPFSLDSIGLANTQGCSCSTGGTIEGFLGGSLVATFAFAIPGNVVGGNGNAGVPASVDIFTLPSTFADVDKIVILPTSGNVNVNDITIDTVAASVPEPSTWGMFIIGFGLIGYVALSRRGGIRLA